MNFYTPLKHKGFTLVELLVVISIIAVISGIAIASYSQAGKNARDNQRLLDAKQLEVALALYYSENGEYPAINGSNSKNYVDLVDILEPDYINPLPMDPLLDFYRLPDDGNGYVDHKVEYVFSNYGSPNGNSLQQYILIIKLESKSDYPYCYIVGGIREHPNSSNGWPVGQYGAENIIGKDCHNLMRN